MTDSNNIYIYDLSEMHAQFLKKTNVQDVDSQKETAGVGAKVEAIHTYESDSDRDSYKLN